MLVRLLSLVLVRIGCWYWVGGDNGEQVFEVDGRENGKQKG